MQVPFALDSLFDRLNLLLLFRLVLRRVFRGYDLCHEFNSFEQNLTFAKCCFDFLLFFVFREVLSVGDSRFFALLDILLVDWTKGNALSLIEIVRVFFFVKGFLCFPLYFFNSGAVQFTLMLFEMQIELWLRVKVLIAYIALNKSRYCTSFLDLHCFYLFLLHYTHYLNIYILKHQSLTQFEGTAKCNHQFIIPSLTEHRL